MNLGAKLAQAALYAVAALLMAALVHFVVVLVIPLVATRDAYAKLTEIGQVGTTYAIPQATPAQHLFSYADPAVATAFCRFDLDNGPIRVRAPIGRSGFASVSFHSRRGAVFYALTDRAATHGRMEAVLVTPAQLRALEADEDEDNPSQDLRIVSPTNEGFVLMRAFSELPSLYGDAEAQAKSLACAPEPSPK